MNYLVVLREEPPLSCNASDTSIKKDAGSSPRYRKRRPKDKLPNKPQQDQTVQQMVKDDIFIKYSKTLFIFQYQEQRPQVQQQPQRVLYNVRDSTLKQEEAVEPIQTARNSSVSLSVFDEKPNGPTEAPCVLRYGHSLIMLNDAGTFTP